MKIKWKACGFDHQDRKGTTDGFKDELQIHFSRGRHHLSFHNATKADFATMEEAKDFAEANVKKWQDERKKEREAYDNQRKDEARKSQERNDREAAVAERLQAVGVEVRVGIGITLPLDQAEALATRLEGGSIIATKPATPQLARSMR